VRDIRQLHWETGHQLMRYVTAQGYDIAWIEYPSILVGDWRSTLPGSCAHEYHCLEMLIGTSGISKEAVTSWTCGVTLAWHDVAVKRALIIRQAHDAGGRVWLELGVRCWHTPSR
jgi:hypothetical protein